MTNGPAVEGGCACGKVRYRLAGTPLFVHGCHCTWCQRQTGTAFATNALIESSLVELVSGDPEAVETPSPSGRGQTIMRCPSCRVALWSHYGASGTGIAFLRVGTLDDPHSMPPDIHIYTSTKQPWLTLPADVPAVPEFYNPAETWPADVMARYKAARTR